MQRITEAKRIQRGIATMMIALGRKCSKQRQAIIAKSIEHTP